MTTLTKADLARLLQENFRFGKDDAKEFVDLFFEQIPKDQAFLSK